MSSIKIVRQDYRRATQTDLSAFTETLLKRTTGVPAYQGLQPFLQPLADLLPDYQAKLIAARNRGLSETFAKNEVQTALLAQLDKVASTLEVQAEGNGQLVVDAGFRLRMGRQTYSNNFIPTPRLLQAVSTGRKGQIEIQVENPAKSKVFNHVVEYSTDREHWTSGAFHSRSKFLVDGLPGVKDLAIRLCSIGRNGRRSAWTDPMLVAVL